MHAGRWRGLATACVLVYAAGGCASSRGSATPDPLEIRVTGGQQLNPDSEGRSLPTSLKILQLKSAEKLEAAEFEQVYGREKEALGDALLRVDELTLSPGESVRKALPREPGARAVAAVALFRKPTGTHWRVIASIPPGRAPPLELGLAEYHIWFASALRTRGEDR